MTKAAIKRYLERMKADPKQRIDRNHGGQYLDNFLYEFAQNVREEILGDIVGTVRQMKREKQ